jgi:hypothetical protein
MHDEVRTARIEELKYALEFITPCTREFNALKQRLEGLKALKEQLVDYGEDAEWIRPVHMNDWGVDYWLRKPATMSGTNTWSVRNEKPEAFIMGGVLLVKWPDGSIEAVVVTGGPSRPVVINDMGHDYHTSTSEPHLLLAHRGTLVSVSIVKLDILVQRVP